MHMMNPITAKHLLRDISETKYKFKPKEKGLVRDVRDLIAGGDFLSPKQASYLDDISLKSKYCERRQFV